MTMRFYEVEIERRGARHVLRVPSETDVQAADAAAPHLFDGDFILSIKEVGDDGLQHADATPPVSQAAEVSDLSEGAASTDRGRPPLRRDECA